MPTPSDRELAPLFDRSPIGTFRVAAGRFVYANPALARLLGYDSAAALLALDLAAVHADPEGHARLRRELRARGVIDGERVQWRRRDGRPVAVLIYGHATDADGTGAGGEPVIDGSVIDLTEIEAASASAGRHQQREELERTARTLDLVVRQVPAVYWLVDHHLRVQRTGGAIEEMLGYPSDRWLGHTLYEVMATDAAGDTARGEDASIAAHLRALAGETVTYASEYRGKRLSTTVAPHHSDGRIAGAIGMSIDVTALHALEQRMVDAQRAESLGVLAGGLAHDFNNLLVAILGNADLGLRETRPGGAGRAALENIRHAALRAAELTDQLLAYAGRGGVGARRVETSAVVDELLRISAPTMPETIAVDVDIPGNLAIRADPAQVRQVLLNLIGNARDALAATGGTISITATSVHHRGFADPDDVIIAEPGHYVRLEIADDGPGIDREARRRIFEPFFTTKATGHGLGLAAVLGIVRAHRGGLRLVTQPGAGARFQVLWPATTTPIEQPVAAPARRTVLVIDDEDLVRDVVARMIEDLGYAAVTAADGPAGLALVDRLPIDLALVDLTMPRMNGADVVAAIRAKKPGLPVVLCTGFDRERRGPITADAYLPKPFRMEALEHTLSKLLPELPQDAGPPRGEL